MDNGHLSNEQLDEIIRENIGAIVYFSTPTCNVCKALKPKVMAEFEENFENIQRVFVDATLSPEVASKYNVFAVPTILVFLDGKEFARESRNVSVAGLVEKISRPYEIMNS